VSGALANLTLSKRSEILDKSSVNETLKESLMKSPLTDIFLVFLSKKSRKKLARLLSLLALMSG
jgi:hypothetical protein